MNSIIYRLAKYIFSLLLMTATLCHNATSAETYQWSNVAIGGSGFVSGIVTSKKEPGLIYARTDVGGAYRWNNSTSRWVPLMDWVSDSQTGFFGVESIAIDPSNPKNLYMLVGTSYLNEGRTAILRSNDYGQTFSKINVTKRFKAHGNGMGRNSGEKLQVDSASGNILYVGTRENGLFKSQDSGNSWAHLAGLNVNSTPNHNGISFVALDPDSIKSGATQRLFVGVSRYGKIGDNIYMSSDAGMSFVALVGGPSGLMPQRAVLAGDDLVITYANGAGPHPDSAVGDNLDHGQVWKYTISTNTWTNISPPFDRAYSGITIDPNNAKRMLVSTINYFHSKNGKVVGDKFFLSNDGGAHWTDIVERGSEVDNNGVSWIKGSFIHWAGCIEFDPFNTKTVMVVSGNGIFKTPNIDALPVIWSFNVSGLEESVALNLISIPNGPVISALGDYDGFRHTDVANYALINSPTMGTTTGLAYAAQQSNIVARAGSAIYLSNDTGKSWLKTGSMHGKNGQLALSADGQTLIHSPHDSKISYYSTDSGSTWTAIQGLEGNNNRVVADPINNKNFYALQGSELYVSINSGRSFAPTGHLSTERGSQLIRTMPGKEGDVWIALYDAGLARSTDSGATFSMIGNVSYAAAIGFGKTAPNSNYPTIYIWGTVNGVRGVFRSIDNAFSWERINDDQHQYGGPGDGQFIVGDMNEFGTVYMSTAGRGIVVGKSIH